VLRYALPAGTAAAAATFVAYEVVRRSDATLEAARTSATLTLLGISLVVLLGISRPLRPWKVGLAAAMGGWYALTMAWSFPRDYFELVIPPTSAWLTAAACTAAGGLLVAVLPRITNRR
jgi:hypothetical protein